MRADTSHDNSTPLPSSPPVPESNLRQSQSVATLITEQDQPIINRILSPKTPANRSLPFEQSDGTVPSSEYYTAAWGSPYEASSTIARSVRTALSEQARSDYSSSPEPRFSLEHLIPSRFGGLRLPEQEQEPELPEAVEETPRSSSRWVPIQQSPSKQRWVEIPKRETAEKTQWWSDSSGNSGAEEKSRKRDHRGHNTREANRTLDQQTFWKEARQSPVDMSGLRASRWASMSEEPDIMPTVESVRAAEAEKDAAAAKARAVADVKVSEEPKSVDVSDPELQAKAGASEDVETSDTAAPTASESTSLPAGKADALQPATANEEVSKPVPDAVAVEEIDDNKLVEAVQDTSVQNAITTQISKPDTPTVKLTEVAAESTQETATQPVVKPAETAGFRLEPPRLKKRMSWRGKACLINIPNIDYVAHGKPVPLDPAEVEQRLKHFEDEGYSTSGYDDQTIVEAHVRPIYPDERERTKPAGKTTVVLPDLNAWRNYMNALTEAKLAALGVSLGDDEPAPTSQEMSRQSSAQFPHTFSPPIPTNSALANARPGFVRGHSHTMSVAAPIQPLNGPYGHMHRHSTFHGISPLQGLQSFSPIPQEQRVPSPPQFNMLRNEFGLLRAGSPLSQSMTPEHTRIAEQQLLPSFGQPPLPPSNFMPVRNLEPPTLPELPEDEDEEELSDPTPYVPPHKRAQVNDEIVIPTPRGHRHNISEGLEREAMLTEQHENGRPAPAFNGFGQAPQVFGQKSDRPPAEKDPLGGDFVVSQSIQSNSRHKKTGSRFIAAAPSFTFNPNATFQPGQAAFNPASTSFAFRPPQHTRQTSSGTFNVSAPEFKPSNLQNITAKPDLNPQSSSEKDEKSDSSKNSNIVEQLPSIFGKVEIPDIVKPARKNKAIQIVKPGALPITSASATDAEGDERPDRSDSRQKRTRKVEGDDGDDVPLFATPTTTSLPQPAIVPSQPLVQSQTAEKAAPAEKPLPKLPVEDTEAAEVKAPATAQANTNGVHKHVSSLSAHAAPWQPSFALKGDTKHKEPSISSLEDGELPADAEKSEFTFPRRESVIDAAPNGPSFDEIDAVMQHLNAGAEQPAPTRKESVYDVQPGVQYIPAWPRSDAPSPSPRRHLLHQHHVPSQDPIEEQRTNGDVWSHVNKLNKARDTPSDWSDMLSPGDDEKLQARSSFFDNRVNDVIGKLLGDRLQPFEDALRNIQLALDQRPTASESKLVKQRSSSAIESDADDEDDSEAFAQRPVSRGREQKLGHIKSIVLEALREQSPKRSQSSYDIADLHSALADMKVSFARAASATLELDDIRSIVEDVVARQPAPVADSEGIDTHRRRVTELEGRLDKTLSDQLEQANQIHEVEQREAEARRMLKLAEEELRLLRQENKDDDSRVQALHDERKKLLEQVDDAEHAQSKAEARIHSLHEERKKLLEQVEDAEDAQNKAEKQVENLRAENEAMAATLEEYRLSSDKWRQSVEETKAERDEIQMTVSVLERQLQDAQESGSGMRRRLEKLHSDLATVMGQLASDKARTKTREEGFRVQCEALEAQVSTHAREKTQLLEQVRDLQTRAADHEQTKNILQTRSVEHEELRSQLQAQIVEHEQAKQAIDNLRMQNAQFDEMGMKTRMELQEQQRIAARFEQMSKEATTAGRNEIARMRMTMEMEVESANHQVSLVRAGLENEISRIRAELDNVRLEAEAAKEKHALRLEEEADVRRENLRAVATTNSTALEAARMKYELAIKDLTQQHSRSLAHAIEDKDRSEYLLNERLVLADSKLQHFQDKILHLEERVEIAKSAAQAAVMNAQNTQSKVALTRNGGLPEKVSPQALRESILVLQEQLQERESRIESLQQKLKVGDEKKLKERDTEIAWLRELLAVRSEDLTDLVNTLSKPTFDRDNVRDTAIRIRTSLQMEQQEKERFGQGSILSNQAIASISNFATPKAAQLTSAFNKWRASMESSALKGRPARPPRSATPSRSTSAKNGPTPSYLSGLMTPPASNLRSSPGPETTSSVPQPKLGKSEKEDETAEPAEPRTPNLFGSTEYDEDADEEPPTAIEEDDDLNVADSRPPAFRSLEDELDEPSEDGVEEEQGA